MLHTRNTLHIVYQSMPALALCFFILFAPTAAQAAEFVWRDREATITEPVDDDLYAIGDILRIDSDIAQDLHAFGQEVHISGRVGDDVLALGGIIRILGEVAEDAFLAASSISILPEAHIGQDAFLAGEAVVIEGRIDGTVRVFSNAVTITDSAVITGDLLIRGSEPVIENGAAIEGSVRVAPMRARDTAWPTLLSTWVRQVLTLFTVAVAIAYLWPHWAARGHASLRKRPILSFFTALAWTLLIIPATLIVSLTLIGIPLAIIAFLGTIILYILAAGLAALLVGNWTVELLSGSAKNGLAKEPALLLTWPNALIGSAIYATIGMLGAFGGFLAILFTMAVFGAMLLSSWHGIRPRRTSS